MTYAIADILGMLRCCALRVCLLNKLKHNSESGKCDSDGMKYDRFNYTMHYKFSNFLFFASFCAHLCAISNTFNCNDENRILSK